MISYVCGFMFNEGKDVVLLIRKNKPEWQKGKLNGVGGKIKSNESSIEAMVREFKEETNLDTKKEDWKQFALLQGPDWAVWFYKAFSDDVYNAESITEEKLQLEQVGCLSYHLIPNLNWLIPLALSEDEIYPVTIYYKE